MSDTTPTRPTGDTGPVEPTDTSRFAPAPLVEPAEPAAEPVYAATVAQTSTGPVEPIHEPGATDRLADALPAEPATAPADTAVAESALTPEREVVFVQAPVPPRVRGNRVVGVILAIVGAIMFALVYGGATALYALATIGSLTDTQVSGFLLSAEYWVPVMIFTLGFLLLVVILNRAAWWAHVLGSLILALLIYGGTIGLLLVAGSVTAFGTDRTLEGMFFAPSVILAAIVARETAIWIGLGIAARGRRITAKNAEARRVFDEEQDRQRAEYARATATGV